MLASTTSKMGLQPSATALTVTLQRQILAREQLVLRICTSTSRFIRESNGNSLSKASSTTWMDRLHNREPIHMSARIGSIMTGQAAPSTWLFTMELFAPHRTKSSESSSLVSQVTLPKTRYTSGSMMSKLLLAWTMMQSPTTW